MKIVRDRPSKFISTVYLSLIICLVVLVIILIAGTIFGRFFHTSSSKLEQKGVLLEGNKGQTYTGIGQIRVPTADPQPSMVIIVVLFIYDPEDKAFSEELAFRTGEFRDIIKKYFGSFSTAELRKYSDEILKTELLQRLNRILRLGQIEILYFSDFIIID